MSTNITDIRVRSSQEIEDEEQQEILRAAVFTFNQAKALEDKANKLREQARDVILKTYQEHSDWFVREKEGGKTSLFKLDGGRGVGVSVTIPVKAGQPSRFDQSRTDEFYQVIKALPGSLEKKVFVMHPEFKQDSYMEWIREHPQQAGELAGLILPFTLPATEATEMSARVSTL